MNVTNFKAKEAVRLRTKPIKNGNLSLYLDIYHKGRRRYEFLRLYLIPEHNSQDRNRNRHSLEVAHRIRNRRRPSCRKPFIPTAIPCTASVSISSIISILSVRTMVQPIAVSRWA